jgi:3',5'-cyclic AMP phosphodiesterase CpdA
VKVVQISDTHLTALGGKTTDSVAKIIDFVNTEIRPDLVVHSGDVVILHPDLKDDHLHARALLEGFDAPLRIVPGNHDVGEPGDSAWMGIEVNDARVEAFEQVWGDDHWRHDLGDWTVLGFNSELFGSGLDREEAQWQWIEETTASLPADRPTMVFLHKPIWQASPEPVDHAVDIGSSRTRLLAALDGVSVQSVGSGHLHCYRQTLRDGVTEVWAPATAFVAPGEDRMPGALHQLGIVEYELLDGTLRAGYRSVPGVVDLDPTQIPQFNVAMTAIESEFAAQ